MSLCAIPKVVCEQPMLGATSLINSFTKCSEHLLIFFFYIYFLLLTLLYMSPTYPPLPTFTQPPPPKSAFKSIVYSDKG